VVTSFVTYSQTYTQQAKLSNSGGTPPSLGVRAQEGISVALSADGNRAILGSPFWGWSPRGGARGGFWIWSRVNDTWKADTFLSSSQSWYNSMQGNAVALSSDGNTALVGGYHDSSEVGSAWVWFRNSQGVWSQQGGKLLGIGGTPRVVEIRFGASVALSSDGNTAIVGAPFDNNQTGAVWIFTRNGSTWTQQGNKLVGTGAAGSACQGWAVDLSSDGKIAIVGGPGDSSWTGAAWIFTRNGTTWTQQGQKLVGTNVAGKKTPPLQGFSVALSGDGYVAALGAPYDSPYDTVSVGAVWVFSRTTLQYTVWTQSKLVASDAINLYSGIGGMEGQGQSVDFDGSNALVIGSGGDNRGIGAVWVWSPINSTWKEQCKLIGSNPIRRPPRQGSAVAVNNDRTTIISGAPNDGDGAAWIFTGKQ